MLTWNEGLTLPTILTEERNGNAAIIQLHIPRDLFQFRGHFPETPVLPGVTQLDWAVMFTRTVLGVHQAINEVAQLKFRSLVMPEAELQLSLEYRPDKSRVRFEYKDQDNVYSSGSIKLVDA